MGPGQIIVGHRRGYRKISYFIASIVGKSMASASSSKILSKPQVPSHRVTKSMNRQKQNMNACDEKTRKPAEMRRTWQSRAGKIRYPAITHKPKPGQDFRYETVASSLPHRQSHGQNKLKRKSGKPQSLSQSVTSPTMMTARYW